MRRGVIRVGQGQDGVVGYATWQGQSAARGAVCTPPKVITPSPIILSTPHLPASMLPPVGDPVSRPSCLASSRGCSQRKKRKTRRLQRIGMVVSGDLNWVAMAHSKIRPQRLCGSLYPSNGVTFCVATSAPRIDAPLYEFRGPKMHLPMHIAYNRLCLHSAT